MRLSSALFLAQCHARVHIGNNRRMKLSADRRLTWQVLEAHWRLSGRVAHPKMANLLVDIHVQLTFYQESSSVVDLIETFECILQRHLGYLHASILILGPQYQGRVIASYLRKHS
ncbi:hypothetical protein BU25DRAFT_43794 [Macroventuria anomochaeta]|uniref:Uncharacterized protein n=1 Tax=Macroventuria anomochaeta TaxID=301207 RepID=A0ACB6S2L2_9PLEO|nr:uncharacterized protein BU25DRAFT_43794 [Macroventuria anomochaeta]KAF2627762.1 hypothetical protein BU25DRAFT_43794 [Macroventuria anomochaeta]